MRALVAVLGLAVFVCALPGAGAAEKADSGPAATAAKRCAKHKHKRKHPRRHHKRRHHRKRCRGANGGSGAGADGSGSSSAKCTSDPGSPGRVAARESEYAIVLSRPSVPCGATIVEQDNTNGMDPHDLVLQKVGNASPSYSFGELAAGGVANKTLDLGKGHWTLYCSISNHRSLGMEVNLVVD